MTREELLAHCLAEPGAWEDEPWAGQTVAKVHGKIFAFLGDEGPQVSVGVKCGRFREEADAWLARYPDDAVVMPYIGRWGWNTLRLGGAIGDDEVVEAVDASYELVVSGLPRRHRPVPARPGLGPPQPSGTL